MQEELIQNSTEEIKLQKEMIQQLENKENENEIPVYIVELNNFICEASYIKFASTSKKKAEEYYEKQSIDWNIGYGLIEMLDEKQTLLTYKTGRTGG